MKITLEVNYWPPEAKDGDQSEVVELEIIEQDDDNLLLTILGNEILISKADLDRVIDLFRGKAF